MWVCQWWWQLPGADLIAHYEFRLSGAVMAWLYSARARVLMLSGPNQCFNSTVWCFAFIRWNLTHDMDLYTQLQPLFRILRTASIAKWLLHTCGLQCIPSNVVLETSVGIPQSVQLKLKTSLSCSNSSQCQHKSPHHLWSAVCAVP
jgi:hypothetical protein